MQSNKKTKWGMPHQQRVFFCSAAAEFSEGILSNVQIANADQRCCLRVNKLE